MKFGFDIKPPRIRDPFGSPTKKERNREKMARIRAKGRAGEEQVAMNYQLRGYEVERTGRGSDFRMRKRNLFTGKVTESKLVEVKTGNSKRSPLQEKTKKKKSNFKEERVEPFGFW